MADVFLKHIAALSMNNNNLINLETLWQKDKLLIHFVLYNSSAVCHSLSYFNVTGLHMTDFHMTGFHVTGFHVIGFYEYLFITKYV